MRPPYFQSPCCVEGEQDADSLDSEGEKLATTVDIEADTDPSPDMEPDTATK